MTALWFLARRQFFNSLRRAKGSPRLVLPFAFFVFIFLIQVVLPFALRAYLGPTMGAHRRNGPLFPPPQYTPDAFVTGGPGTLIASVRGMLLVSVMGAITTALGDGGAGGLLLSLSDVDYLFPAPLKRRQVLLFKMLGRWASLVLPAIYLPLAVTSAAIRPWNAPSLLAYWPGMMGMWLFMAAVTNATQAAGLWRLEKDAPLDDAPENSPLARKHEAGVRRRESARRVLIALIWVVIAGFVYLMVGGLHGLFGSGGESDTANLSHAAAVQTFLRTTNGNVVSGLLAPLAWASDLFAIAFRGWRWADTGRFAGLIALFGGSCVLLFSRDRDFYENAVDTTARRARVVQAMQKGDAGTIVTELVETGKLGKSRKFLRTTGPGAGAILWKDLVGLSRTPLRSWVPLLIVAAFPAIFGLLFGRKYTEVGILLWLLTFTLQMSGVFLLGLRDMLRRADLTKALPIAPLPFIAAELAASILQQSLLGFFSLTLSGLAGMGFGQVMRGAYLVFPTVAALVLFTQAIFVLLYPRKNDAAQNAAGSLTGLFASLIALVPCITAGAVLFLLHVSPVLLAFCVGLVNLLCAFIALCVAAALWQRFDPTDG